MPSGRLVRGRGLRDPMPTGHPPAFGVYLLGEEPPVRFGRCALGGAFAGGLRGVWLSKPAQHRAAGCVHQVICTSEHP